MFPRSIISQLWSHDVPLLSVFSELFSVYIWKYHCRLVGSWPVVRRNMISVLFSYASVAEIAYFIYTKCFVFLYERKIFLHVVFFFFLIQVMCLFLHQHMLLNNDWYWLFGFFFAILRWVTIPTWLKMSPQVSKFLTALLIGNGCFLDAFIFKCFF